MLEPQLLKTCSQHAERLLDLEREVDQAKADYHYAIRRLHLAGGSYREIAAALGLSHQRVNQIVGADSRGWLRRWLAPGREERRLACSFCGRSAQIVDRLVAGPRVEICDACITAAEAMLQGRRVAEAPTRFTTFETTSKVRCSFCGKKGGKDRQLVGAAADAVCDACAAIARSIANGPLA